LPFDAKLFAVCEVAWLSFGLALRRRAANRQRNSEETTVFRYSLRELLWLTLVAAVASAWWVEAARGRQWQQRAEVAAGQLEAENFGKMVFEPNRAVFLSPLRDPAHQETVFPTESSR
jgi:hypothetical protein